MSMHVFEHLLGPKCATGVVLPANYLTSSDSSYLPGLGPSAPSPAKLSWVPLAVGAVLIGGVLYFVAKGAAPVLANPGLPDGVAKRKHFTARDADPRELARGTRHEMEHTRNKQIARQIALDHLAEDSKYYTHLAAAGVKDNPLPWPTGLEWREIADGSHELKERIDFQSRKAGATASLDWGGRNARWARVYVQRQRKREDVYAIDKKTGLYYRITESGQAKKPSGNVRELVGARGVFAS